MKKRSCKMTQEEKTEHEFAVKIRKMTDRQLYEFVNSLTSRENKVENFLNCLEKHTVSGIGSATIAKIKDFAVSEGFIDKI